MYIPAAFRIKDRTALHAAIGGHGLATLVTATAAGPVATHLPLLLDPDEGPLGTLYGHVARANPHWSATTLGDALAIFRGPDSYVSPSWYPAKAEHGRVVPTWDYVAIHAAGQVTFFDEPERLLDVVRRLTEKHEASRETPWAVADAPDDYIAGMLRGIVGLRLPIARLEGSCKMSQNRSAADRAAVLEALRREGNAEIAEVAGRVLG